MQLKVFAVFVICALSLLLLPESRGKTSVIRVMEEEEEDPPEVAAGERLFRETRFAQYFFAHAAGPNQPLEKGDPSLYQMKTAKGAPLQNPYIGKSMNCAVCHLVDEVLDQAGMRSYADFSLRSFVPFRAEDRESETPRNSPSLVGAVRPDATFLHFDGEFVKAEDLVIAGWVGRNNGWLASEGQAAMRHIARILREDDGSFSEDGISYEDLFAGKTDLPAEFRLDLAKVSDERLIQTAASLVRAYMEGLEFTRTSAFDLFLEKNGLPGEPEEGEAAEAFHLRLLSLLRQKTDWIFVDETLEFHAHPSKFGPEQLNGLKLFLDSKSGNCASCHQLPHFTDSLFHNTGISQFEYDGVHGPAAFMALRIPTLSERLAEDLPADAGNLRGLSTFRSKPVATNPRLADLGLWNIFANPSYPKPQNALTSLLCEAGKKCKKGELLEASVARFKTPSLRDLGHSAPFFHNGSAHNLEDVVADYVMAGMLARQGDLRNGAPELVEMNLHGRDIAPLAAFLESLDEDYE